MTHLHWSTQIGIAVAVPMIGAVGSGTVDFPTPAVEIEAARGLGQAGDSAAVAGFMDRVKVYVAMHQKLEATLPHLPKEATPEQIAQRERTLAVLIQSERATAKRGDLFTPAMTGYLRGLLKQVFSRADGKKLRASIMDEYPGPITLRVNGRYPDTVPIASMPAEVLAALPTLPEELEYRFVGDQFILFDPHAHIIPDFITGALPTV